MITVERLKHLVDYDPERGVFIHKNPISNRVRKGQVAGSKCKEGYMLLGLDGVRYYVHRLVLHYHGVDVPEGCVVDHINQNKQDNRLSNLRVVDRKMNARNNSYKQERKVCGVYFNKSRGKWVAELGSCKTGTYRYIGSFDTYEAAARERKSVEGDYGYTDLHGSLQEAEV